MYKTYRTYRELNMIASKMDNSPEDVARDDSAVAEPNDEPARQKRLNKRWEDDETLLLIQTWEKVLENARSSVAGAAADKDESQLSLSSRLFQLFAALQGGSTIRTESAVNTKMTTLEMSFQFITKFNRALSRQSEHIGGGDSRDWFSLSKAEKREVKEANCLDNRVIDLSRTVYEALRSVVSCDNAEKEEDDAEDGSDFLIASNPIDSEDDELRSSSNGGGGVYYCSRSAGREDQGIESRRNARPEAADAAVRAHKKRKLPQLEAAIDRQDAQVKELLAEIRQELNERMRENQRKEQARQEREVERRREREEDRQMMWALINELKRQNERIERTNW